MKRYIVSLGIRITVTLGIIAGFLIFSPVLANLAFSQEVDSYEWVQVTGNAAWEKRLMHTAFVHDNKLWISGGLYHDEFDFLQVRVLSDVWWTETGTEWYGATDAFPGRGAHTTVVHGNRIWALGGSMSGLYDSLNDIWSSDTGVAWTQTAAAADWQSRALHSSVVFNDNIWVLGGVQMDLSGNPIFSMFNDVWWSREGVTWEQCEVAEALWEGRCSHSSIIYDDRMWVMGGMTFTGEGYYITRTTWNDVWCSEDGVNWIQATSSAPWEPRFGHTSVVYDGKMWVIGGGDKDYYNDAWFSTDGEHWTEAAVMGDWQGAAGHASAVHDGKVWILGGERDNAGLNEVWYLHKTDLVEGEGETEWIPHPGDLNADFRMTMEEALACLAGWQQGTRPMNYAIRAVYLWQHGEHYAYDAGQIPPLCWILKP